MELAEAEKRLGITLPPRHRQAMLDPTDPIHRQCIFLLLHSPHEMETWVAVNEDLHAEGRWNRLPPFLIAFAGNGCGDWFAYDIRTQPYRIYYLDPLNTAEESVQSCDTEGFVFENFEQWYMHQLDASRIDS